jgi:hypothetical protein
MQQPVFTNSLAMIVYLDPHDEEKDMSQWQGDYGLSYVELVERLGGSGDEKLYKIRLAPLHVHVGTRTRLIEVTAEQHRQMMFVKFDFCECFLAPCTLFSSQLPIYLASENLVYVEQICKRPDKSIVTRITSATLHLDGAFGHTVVKEHNFIVGLPLQSTPKRPHRCSQRELLGVLDSCNQECRL